MVNVELFIGLTIVTIHLTHLVLSGGQITCALSSYITELIEMAEFSIIFEFMQIVTVVIEYFYTNTRIDWLAVASAIKLQILLLLIVFRWKLVLYLIVPYFTNTIDIISALQYCLVIMTTISIDYTVGIGSTRDTTHAIGLIPSSFAAINTKSQIFGIIIATIVIAAVDKQLTSVQIVFLIICVCMYCFMFKHNATTKFSCGTKHTSWNEINYTRICCKSYGINCIR